MTSSTPDRDTSASADAPARRLTREEQRARTREDLLDAARTVFARQGYHATSVDQVADAAGYTKGAVYSNFSSKEELFLALWERHVATAVDMVQAIIADTPPAERAAALGASRGEFPVFDRDWFLLDTEFTLLAARNPHIAERMVAPSNEVRRRLAALAQQHFDEIGAAPPLPVDDLATLGVAAGDGLMLLWLTNPEINTGELFTKLLALLFTSAEPAQRAEQPT